MTAPLRLFASALLLAGCGDGAPTTGVRVAVGDLEGALFFLSVEGSGAPARLEGPLVIDGGVRRCGERPEWVLGGKDGRLLVVALPLSELAGLEPHFTPAVAAELVLRPAAPAADLTRGWHPLPAFARVFEVDVVSGALEPSALPSGLELFVGAPRDPEHCRPDGWSGLAPYGSELHPLGELAPAERLIIPRVAVVDAARVLLTSGAAGLALLERGRAFSPRGAANLLAPEDFTPAGTIGAAFVSVARAPRHLESGPARFWALLEAQRGGEPFEGWLLELRVDAGELRPGELVPLGTGRADDLDVNLEGDVVVTGRGAPVRVLRASTRSLETVTDLGLEEHETAPRRVHWTGVAAHPLLASTLSWVHLYAPRDEGWHSTRLRAAGEPPRWVRGLVSVPEEEDLWISGGAGTLFRRQGSGAWTHRALSFPPRWAGCAQGTDHLRHAFESLTLLGEHLLLLPRGCRAILTVRRRDECVALIDADGAVRAHLESLVSLAVAEDQIVAVGERGALWFAERTGAAPPVACPGPTD